MNKRYTPTISNILYSNNNLEYLKYQKNNIEIFTIFYNIRTFCVLEHYQRKDLF
jgi:hypothetical protein